MTRVRRTTLWRNVEGAPTVETFRQAMARHIQGTLGRDEFSQRRLDRFYAVCFSVRDQLMERWVNTQQTYYQENARRVYYLSMEYLMGRALHNAVINLGIEDIVSEALRQEGFSLQELQEQEPDAGLGNGGLGRLAACFLDSMATLGLPAFGYGLRYDYGIFAQAIQDGHQVEQPDTWLRLPYPWEIPRPEYLEPNLERHLVVRFGGHVEHGPNGARWIEEQRVVAMAYDQPVPGYSTNTVNTLRLWRASPEVEFDFKEFNEGDYIGAMERRTLTTNITRVLYPNDNIHLGKELRLKQQYLLVSATLQDAIRRHLVTNPSVENLHEKAVFQLNDTHPALAVAELMRLLTDEHALPWDRAWEVTRGCMAYTNHTLLPEALERWNTDLFGRLLPRHIEVINRINHEFLEDVRRRFPGDEDLVRRVSIYKEGNPKRLRMANLAVVGSFSVNGVAELHTDLLKSHVLNDFHRLWPERFNNKTNGVTQRRWLLGCNPPLAQLLTRRLGPGWVTDLTQLRGLVPLATDPELQAEFARTKQQAKERLVGYLADIHGFSVDPTTLFDIQIKRIHEYKRQLLNALHIIHLYARLLDEPGSARTARTFIFGGKAAPGYHLAKLIVKLIHDIADRVNHEPRVNRWLHVCFVPNYGVSAGERLFPAADVSEQISTAGFEASGTGNMKFAMNGAITVGTLDGANVEIAREVGEENIFIFGHQVPDVARLRAEGYRPRSFYDHDENIRRVLDLLASGHFNPREPDLYRPICDRLLSDDFFLHMADFDAYRRAHLRVEEAYARPSLWRRMALHNIAHSGFFSSDRTIREYATDIWKVKPFSIEVE